ncbi:MAG: hypothetical protein FWH43_07175 [Endomicrobia bacterium]|nr:hypothetical protein [Endomicrobiia bacterium]
MNKKLVFTILIGLFIFTGISVSYADIINSVTPKRTYSVEISFAHSIEKSNIVIDHMPIERVSVNMRTLVATGTVILQGPVATMNTMFLQYYTDDDTVVKTSSITYTQLSERLYSFVTEPIIIGKSTEYIYYNIIADASDGGEGKYPRDNSYIEANLKQMKSQYIDTAGGVFTLQSGDQTKGNTIEIFASGALLSGSNFRIKELYTSESLPYLGNLRPIITYEFTPADLIVTNQALMPSITLYYGDPAVYYGDINVNDIEVRWLNGTSWEKVNFTNDVNMRTVTVNVALTNNKLGYYGIFEKTKLTDNDYRPEYRVFKLGEKLQFRNLQAGDSVTIYDINGRQVRKLTASPFEWDGRKTDGSYAESGSYIYQIKVNGKIISGSVAFVR